MNKRPAEQWYTGDWYRAVDIQKCCPATRGIWRDAIDAMTNEQITGKIRGTREEICQLLRCNNKELQRFVDDNKAHRFASVTLRNEKVTIICRRLYRLYLEREATKKRVRKHREGKQQEGNAEVTPYSSTSSSSSTSKEEYMLIFEAARKRYPSTKKGLQTEYKNFVKKHTDWKDILPLLLPAIEQQIIWRQQDGRYWKHFQTWINQRSWEEEASNQVQEKKNGSKTRKFPSESKVGETISADD